MALGHSRQEMAFRKGVDIEIDKFESGTYLCVKY